MSSQTSSGNSKNQAVSIVVPTYNGLKLLKANLKQSISILGEDDELVIIDDASQDKTVGWLVKKFDLEEKQALSQKDFLVYFKPAGSNFPQVKLIRNKKNIRFAASCNRAVSLAHNNLIFLINNDVIPHDNVLKKLTPWFEDRMASRGSDVFAVGCLEIEYNRGGIKGGKNKLWFERGMFLHSRADNFETGPTAWASGGSAMFDKDKWLKLDGFDLDYYPAYWEDVDLSFRAKQKGWKVIFEKEALVDHNHESTNQTAFGQQKIDSISWKNANKFVWKNGSIWQKVCHLLWKPYWWLKGKR